ARRARRRLRRMAGHRVRDVRPRARRRDVGRPRRLQVPLPAHGSGKRRLSPGGSFILGLRASCGLSLSL
ncbi:MAG: hypothetical protein AVDCRST_MAG55-2521, partial [uncultured Rubrobacteraceae bacterium]